MNELIRDLIATGWRIEIYCSSIPAIHIHKTLPTKKQKGNWWGVPDDDYEAAIQQAAQWAREND